MTINYNYKSKKDNKNWIIAETDFDYNNLAKFETIFSLGNGYMGLRAATEEAYIGEQRGFFIAGLFDRFADEVTELPNITDWLCIDIILDGEKFNLRDGKILFYNRRLNLQDGELIREIRWESPGGNQTYLKFKRFVSLANKHIGGIKVIIKPLDYRGEIKIVSGLNGRVTNMGTQHLIEGDKRNFPDDIFYMDSKTIQSDIYLITAASHDCYLNGEEIKVDKKVSSKRRALYQSWTVDLRPNDQLEIDKLVSVYSSKDLDFKDETGQSVISAKAIKKLREIRVNGYTELFRTHQKKWQKYWSEMDIKIDGPDFDQLAVRFALFHLIQMTPTHDSRISIAAKGLSGEGYKGHVFWDTEIFILPFFIFTFPDIARNLLLYRYHTLDGARQKARNNGYRGAMFAWESADTGEETTPGYGEVDLKTGKPIRIWCGEIEQHISADIAYAIWQYFLATADQDFMDKYGYEMFFEIARFWASRVEYNKKKDHYEIKDVIGPDEYSEHVNNNAYTNYLVKWQLEKAVEMIKESDKNNILWEELSLTEEEVIWWKEISQKIYTPIDEESGIIEQFDGFIKQPEIDLSAYHGKVGKIVKERGWEEITKSQVLKQADVLMLLYLLEENFADDIKKANWDFYEPKTLHDSSLSPSIHTIVAADMNKLDDAYRYFERTIRIDLGDNMKSCDNGLHAASLGGIWQAVVMGFAGLNTSNGKIEFKPRLCPEWKSLSFKIKWRGKGYRVVIENEQGSIKIGVEKREK